MYVLAQVRKFLLGSAPLSLFSIQIDSFKRNSNERMYQLADSISGVSFPTNQLHTLSTASFKSFSLPNEAL